MNEKLRTTQPVNDIQVDQELSSTVMVRLPKSLHLQLKQFCQEDNVRQQELSTRLLTWAITNYREQNPAPPEQIIKPVVFESIPKDSINDLTHHIMASQFKNHETKKTETGSNRVRFVALLHLINMLEQSRERATSDKIASMIDASPTFVYKLVAILEKRGVIVKTKVTNDHGFGRAFWLHIAPNAIAALNKAHRAETGRPIFPSLSSTSES